MNKTFEENSLVTPAGLIFYIDKEQQLSHMSEDIGTSKRKQMTSVRIFLDAVSCIVKLAEGDSLFEACHSQIIGSIFLTAVLVWQ